MKRGRLKVLKFAAIFALYWYAFLWNFILIILIVLGLNKSEEAYCFFFFFSIYSNPWPIHARDTRAILLHQLSKKLSHNPFKKLHGLPVSAVFHPSRSIFFVSTKKNVRVYDLLKLNLIKKLETGLREVSSIAIHPAGNTLCCYIKLIVISGTHLGNSAVWIALWNSKEHLEHKAHTTSMMSNCSVWFFQKARSYPIL